MRWQHHPLCMWFRPNLASPGAVTWEDNIIVFICGLDRTLLHREQLHEKSTLSSLYVIYTKPPSNGSSYVRSQNHRPCMCFILTLASPGAVTWEDIIIIFACGLDQSSLHQELLHEKSNSSSVYVVYTNPRFTGSYYMRSQHHCLLYVV
jgi:hypothetical protein